MCDISKKYRFRNNFVDIVTVSIFDTALTDFDIYRKGIYFAIFIEISKNISINLQHLVCDCAITLEMKVGSVLSSHFKNLSASFLGLFAIVCVQIVFQAYL